MLPTDTVYGIHGLAQDKNVVEKIYEIRERNPQKPFIILVASVKDLTNFKVHLTPQNRQLLNNILPNKVSVILPCPNKEYNYLHRGTNTLAFRIPKISFLRKLLLKAGPLISTSINPQGMNPATTIKETKDYFGDKLDFYLNAGTIQSAPSTLVKIDGDEIKILRQGEVEIKKMNLPQAHARGIFSLRTSSVFRNPRLYSQGFLAIKSTQGPVAHLVRALAWHVRGSRFKSDRVHSFEKFPQTKRSPFSYFFISKIFSKASMLPIAS